MRDYTKIEAWRLADDLTVAVYERTRSFPEKKSMDYESIATRCLFEFRDIVEGASERARKITFTFFILRAARYQRLNISFTSRCDSNTCRQRRLMLANNEGNVCLFARSYSGSRKRSGKLSKVVATVTSLIVIGLMRCSGGQLSVVS